MWQVVVVCGRVWGHVVGADVCYRGSALWHRWVHVAVVGTYGRVLGHVAGCGGMWQRWWQGVGACHRVWGYVVWGQAYSLDEDLWQGWAMWHGVGPCGRVWEHVAGCGVMWQGVEACHTG